MSTRMVWLVPRWSAQRRSDSKGQQRRVLDRRFKPRSPPGQWLWRRHCRGCDLTSDQWLDIDVARGKTATLIVGLCRVGGKTVIHAWRLSGSRDGVAVEQRSRRVTRQNYTARVVRSTDPDTVLAFDGRRFSEVSWDSMSAEGV